MIKRTGQFLLISTLQIVVALSLVVAASAVVVMMVLSLMYFLDNCHECLSYVGWCFVAALISLNICYWTYYSLDRIMDWEVL